jgi:hypothetical protein
MHGIKVKINQKIFKLYLTLANDWRKQCGLIKISTDEQLKPELDK